MNIFKKRKGKLSRRITWRVILIVSVISAVMMALILAFVFAVSIILSAMRGQYVTDGIGGKMETMLRAVEISAANNVAEIEDNLDSPAKVFDALEHELRLNKNYLGCFVAFEPDYYKSQGRWFEPYVKYSDSTRVVRSQIGSADHDYLSRDWYKTTMKKGVGYLSDPYYDPDGGKTFLCSYLVPVHDSQGRKVGVYGIDLNLEWLLEAVKVEEKKVRKMEFFEDSQSIDDEEVDSFFFLQIIDGKGSKIAGSDFDSKLLKGEQKREIEGLEMKDLKGTPYYINSKQLASTGWTLIVVQHKDFVFMWGEIIATIMLSLMGFGIVIIFFFMRRSIRNATKPLGFLSDSAKEVAKGNFDTELPTFKRQDEISDLRDSFGTMQQSLKQYVEDLKVSTAAKASIESELKIAQSIQMSMLPKTFPAFPDRQDIDLYASLASAKGVGGDLYDFFILNEKLFFCIGDVSGKGVPAALVMAVTRTLFRNISAHTAQPSHIVHTMNMNISEGNENDMFVTLFVGVLDLVTGRLNYCNAGHNAPYVNGVILPCDANLPVGVMPDWKFTEQETKIDSGTTVFLYTDGLTEAESASHELFGEQRVDDVIANFDGTPLGLIETMAAAVHQFVGDTEQSDDLTMLSIKFNK